MLVIMAETPSPAVSQVQISSVEILPDFCFFCATLTNDSVFRQNFSSRKKQTLCHHPRLPLEKVCARNRSNLFIDANANFFLRGIAFSFRLVPDDYTAKTVDCKTNASRFEMKQNSRSIDCLVRRCTAGSFQKFKKIVAHSQVLPRKDS